jgi:aminopeptidase N
MFGAAENPTAVFYDGAAYPAHSLSEVTVAHETAHQWFGDAVTEADWHHLWLSEGFATYFAALWLGHAEGDSAFRAEMRRQAETVFKSRATERPILDAEATDLMGLLNSNNYPKGAWVLHMLRGLVGESAFRAGIRDWYSAYRDSAALSSDFSDIMSRAAGQDLTWYFRQALTQPGYPKLAVSWVRKEKGLVLTLRQTQAAEWGVFRMPGLGVQVDGKLVRVDIEGRDTEVRMETARKQTPVIVVDPEGWWLLEATGPESDR